MEKKKFDKNVFKKSQTKLMILYILIGVFAIASIICSLFVGNALLSFGIKDPKDYYGSYYSVLDYDYIEFEITKDECVYKQSRGIPVGTVEEKSCKYDFVSADYAKRRFGSDFKEEYEGYNAILVYTEAGSKQYAITLWVISDDPYMFIIDKTGAEVTSEPYSFKEDMGDPEDYYCTYTYNNDNKVTFNKNGTATWKFNGSEESWSFAYVNKAWLETWTEYDYDAALICYKPGQNGFRIIEYKSKTELVYLDKHSFTGTGSEAPTKDEEDSSEDDDDSTSSDTESEVSSDSTSQEMEFAEWSSYFDFDNVDIEYRIKEDGVVISGYDLVVNGDVDILTMYSSDYGGTEDVYTCDGDDCYCNDEYYGTASDFYLMTQALTGLIDFSANERDFEVEEQTSSFVKYYATSMTLDTMAAEMDLTDVYINVTKTEMSIVYENGGRVVEATITYNN